MTAFRSYHSSSSQEMCTIPDIMSATAPPSRIENLWSTATSTERMMDSTLSESPAESKLAHGQLVARLGRPACPSQLIYLSLTQQKDGTQLFHICALFIACLACILHGMRSNLKDSPAGNWGQAVQIQNAEKLRIELCRLSSHVLISRRPTGLTLREQAKT